MAKVRIAVAVDSSGYWAANGYGTIGNEAVHDEELMDECVETFVEGVRQYFVEVEIEPPVIETINAEAIEVAK